MNHPRTTPEHRKSGKLPPTLSFISVMVSAMMFTTRSAMGSVMGYVSSDEVDNGFSHWFSHGVGLGVSHGVGRAVDYGVE